MMIAAPTEMIRATLTQEARVIVPPLGMKVNTARLMADVSDLMLAAQQNRRVPYFVQNASVDPAMGSPYIRRVQILVPSSPGTNWDLDLLPEAVGPNRIYKIPPVPSGQTIYVDLAPWQWVIGASVAGNAFCSVIVSYYAATPALMQYAERHPTP